MSKILLIGSTGMVGSRVAAEVTSRGHELTEATRSGGDGRVALDATDAVAVAALAAGHDVIVSAISPPRDGTPPAPPLVAAGRAIIEAARTSGTTRVVVVGGAGSLLLPDNTRVVDQDWFPDEVRPEALAHVELLSVFENEAAGIDWSYLSPPGQIAPGERTGQITLGADHVVGDSVSAEDFAVALIDEVEQGNHLRQRFTVANT